jgi:hypothetical protein
LDGSEIQVEGKFVPFLQDLNEDISRNSSVNERDNLDSMARRIQGSINQKLVRFSNKKFRRNSRQKEEENTRQGIFEI